jgi:hypothetical protein
MRYTGDPHRKSEVDRRTPSDLLDLVEAKGQEIADAIKALRAMTIAYGQRPGNDVVC